MRKKVIKYTDDKSEIEGDLRPLKKGELPSLDQLVGKLHRQTKVTPTLVWRRRSEDSAPFL